MSGSSGPSNSAVGGGGRAGEQDPCASIHLTRTLEAPVPGVADLLAAGDVLTVQLDPGPPEVAAILQSDGSLAGSIVPTVRLLECLRQGVAFEAEVQSADGGAVYLEIRAVS
jgi:hypothetical protein